MPAHITGAPAAVASSAAVAEDARRMRSLRSFRGAATAQGSESGDGIGAPRINRAAITASITCATIMQGVDTTIANVALPHIQGSFSCSQDQIAWVVTSYIVAAAIMTPLTGWLAGRLGIK